MKKSIILFLFVVLIISLFFSCDNDNNDIEKYWEFYNSKLESFKQENLEYKNKSVDVVFLGDSLTEGYNIEEFYPEYVVLNRGISGDTTVGLEQRLDVSLFAIQPKVAVMLIGANNMDTMLENYESILKSFKENVSKTKIILLSLTSMSGEWGKKNHLAAYNTDVAVHIVKCRTRCFS